MMGENHEKLELASESIPPREDYFIEQLGILLRNKVRDMYPPGKTLRDAHPKQHGTVMAEFIIEPDLPQDLRVGILKESRTYPALIRFSNADPAVSPDTHKDVRGMAIKLIGVEGEKLLEDERQAKTQDFITISYNVFFTKDVEELYNFTRAFFKGKLNTLWFLFNPIDPHLRVFRNIQGSAQSTTSLLDIRYWSMTPYLFGEGRAVKYSVRPWMRRPAEIPKDPPECYLREALKEGLSHDPAYFDFMVQFQSDPYKMPIEDAGKAWDEELSPFQKVATIVIPPQTFDTARQMEFGDNMSFTPWHSLPEHRPLGGINRCRKVVYQEISRFRHERNETPRREPSIEDLRLWQPAKAHAG
jgi:hypothetical protein